MQLWFVLNAPLSLYLNMQDAHLTLQMPFDVLMHACSHFAKVILCVLSMISLDVDLDDEIINCN